MKKNENSYKKSGVNISLANKLVDHISKISKKGVKKRKGGPEKDVIGGFGSSIVELLNDNDIHFPVLRIGIPDKLVDHASPDQSKQALGLTSDQMAKKIIDKFN